MAEKKLKDNQIEINEKIYTIKPVKMKYIRESFYSYHISIKEIGFVNLVANYANYEEVLIDYLTAIFDSEEIASEIIEDIDAQIISTIREKVNKINDIDEDPNEQRTQMETV